MSNCEATGFAYPDAGIQGPSLFAKISGKATRFLARNLHSKVLVMRNARPLVSFSFDDVASSACSLGAPILERYGIRGTFYVAGAAAAP